MRPVVCRRKCLLIHRTSNVLSLLGPAVNLHAEIAFATSAPSMMIEDHTKLMRVEASLHLACILPSDPRLSLKLHQGHRMSSALVDAVSSH